MDRADSWGGAIMKRRVQSLPDRDQDTWNWPFDLADYDRDPALSQAERNELDRLMGQQAVWQIRKPSKAILQRLLHPIEDVMTYINLYSRKRYDLIRVMLIETYRRGTAFWGWTVEEWCESMCSDKAAFGRRYGWQVGKTHPARHLLPAIAYLFDTLPDVSALFALVEVTPLAQKIFGKERIDIAVQRVETILRDWGYRQKEHIKLLTCICYLLLLNKSPHLEDLTGELFEVVNQTCTIVSVRLKLLQVSRALTALGILSKPLANWSGKPVVSGTDGSLAEEWLSWCQRWQKYAIQQNSETVYYQILKVGRWLKVYHPEVTGPAEWTYELSIELVAAVNEMKVGEWTDTQARRIPADRTGQPLRPRAKDHLLSAMRTFLRDCQEWGWIPVRLNPHRALKTPRAIRNFMGPDPRIIDKDLWAKILWAAMNLEAKDLPLQGKGNRIPPYPLEMVRAIAITWCFAALRSDEICRLRVGCIRWQYEDVMVPETGDILPKDAICFLDIPVNKTNTSYTKAVHTLVGKRINEWEQVRPQKQLKELDGKTSESIQFLFLYRGARVSKDYINDSLIPILCKKAGVPEEDSRGAITSHRARATIASMLYNAREPLDIFQIKEYLGHKHLSSTQSYVKVDPTKLASQVAKAGYLEQNLATIEVLLDQDAVRSGAAANGAVWKYYDLGHGYCTNDFWADCKHRMACARCPFYRPKDSLKDQLVEGQANLVRMLEFVKLTEDERLLVNEGIELHQSLIEKLADVPTPAGPTPRELEISRQHEKKVIPLKSVQRSKRKKQDEQQVQSSQEEES